MNITAQCKKCRRAGEKLFLKGDRCFTQKCAMVKRPYPPGIHGSAKKGRAIGRGRKSFSEYGAQLAEKQKLKRIYGISEKQFKIYVKALIGKKDVKKEDLLVKLEKRLDNTIYRLGFAKSRNLARQIVNHGHIIVNKRKVTIPSYQVKKSDIIKIKQSSQSRAIFKPLIASLKKHDLPAWLKLDKDKLEGQVLSDPKSEEIGKTAEISKIIEFYSR